MKKINYSTYKKPTDFISFEQGETRIRVISSGVIGFQHVMKTANRFVNLGPCSETKDCEHCKKGFEPKQAWKWIVFDYTDLRAKLLDAGPMLGNQICMLGGDPQDFDILVTRAGEKLKTEYKAERSKENKGIPEEVKTNLEFMKHRLITKYFKKQE